MSDEADPKHARLSIPRRRLLIGGAASALAAGALFRVVTRRHAAVSAKEKLPSGPRSGGELRVAFDGAAISVFNLDPHNSGFAPHNRVMRSIYDNLTVLLPDGTIGPWLAESWEISPDRTEYTFRLKKGVTFHDGGVFDAAAVQKNFERLTRRESTLISRQSVGPFKHAEVLAPDVLRVTLAEPFAPFLRNLSSTKLPIVSPTAVEKFGTSFSLNPVGTGPFRFLSLKQGTEIRLERNPDYRWAPPTARLSGPARVDHLTFLNVPEESTRVAVLRSRQVHAADLIPPQFLRPVRAEPGLSVLEQELLETNYSLMPNVTSAPWNDVEMRQALKWSLDIDTIVKVVYQGTFTRAWSILSPSMFGSAEQQLANSWQPDRARAAKILDHKGWPRAADGIRTKGGKRLSIRFIDSQGNREKRLDVLQLVRRQLAANGIDLTVDTQPTGTYQARVTHGEYDLVAGASFHADPDILRQAFVPAYRTPLSGYRVDDAELSEWLNAASQTQDGPERVELYQRAQRKILEQAYSIPIYVLRYNVGVVNTLQGLRFDAHGFPVFHEAWLDEPRDA